MSAPAEARARHHPPPAQLLPANLENEGFLALHTCIAAGDAIEVIQPLIDIPIVRVDRPMMLEALFAP